MTAASHFTDTALRILATALITSLLACARSPHNACAASGRPTTGSIVTADGRTSQAGAQPEPALATGASPQAQRVQSPVGQFDLAVLTTVQLASRRIQEEGALVITSGRDAPDDGGGAIFRGIVGDRTKSDGVDVLEAVNGRWFRVESSGSLTIKQIGCRDDGSNDCGSILNAFMARWKAAYGANSELMLEVPSKAPLSYGYRLSTPIRVPDQMMVTIRGRAPPRVNTFSFRASSKGEAREGAVFVVDPNVSGFSRYPDAAVYPFAHLENIAFVGPGAPYTSGACVDTWYFSERISTKNVQCYGFRYGFQLRGGVQHHGHQYPRAYGCTYGMVLGGPKGAEIVDADIYGAELHFNEYALVLQHASSISLYGPILEGNLNGLMIGVAGGGHNVANVMIENAYLESNGSDNATSYSSGSHVLMHDGGSITNLVLRQFKCSGDGRSEARAVYAPKSSVIVFDTCAMNGQLTMGESSTVAFLGPDPVKGGFTSVIPHAHSRLVRPGGHIAPRRAPVKGLVTHSWAQDGEEAYYVLKGNVTLQVPSDAIAGARVRYRFRNGPQGGFTVALQPGIAGRLDNARNGPNSVAELELHYVGGIWSAVWSGWL